MDAPAGAKDLLIEANEFGVGETPGSARFSELGVGEGQPDLRDFVGCKIFGKFIDVGAEKSGISDVGFQTGLCADVEAIAFQVDAKEIAAGVHFGETDRIFPLSAGQLEGEGMRIFEKGGPLAGHSLRILQDVGKGFDSFEANEFLLAHKGAKVRAKIFLYHHRFFG